MGNFGLALIYLKRALQQSGCPVCRCCAEHETRYLKFLLWENVNDYQTRLHLVRSLGFCKIHSHQMLDMEREEYGMMLGNSIIYESLIQLALHRLHDTQHLLADQQTRGRWAQRLWLQLGIGRSPRSWRRERYLEPEAPCRVCQLSDEAARHYSATLAEMLTMDECRMLYERSDGICLLHLRTMLHSATSDQGLNYILSHTEERLARLRGQLESLGDKYSVSHRDEPVTTDETLSVERAIAFLTGSAP